MDRKIIIYSDDQEDQEIAVVDTRTNTELMSLHQSHDEHGWSGMEMARDIAEEIGKALGVTVERQDKDFS